LVEWHGVAPRKAKPKKSRFSEFADADNAAHLSRTSSIDSNSENVTDFQAAYGPQARRVVGLFPLGGGGETPSTSATTLSTGAGSSVIVKTGCNADRAAVIDLHISLEPVYQVHCNL